MNNTEKFYLVILGWGEGSGLGEGQQVSPWAWSLAFLKSMWLGMAFIPTHRRRQAGLHEVEDNFVYTEGVPDQWDFV